MFGQGPDVAALRFPFPGLPPAETETFQEADQYGVLADMQSVDWGRQYRVAVGRFLLDLYGSHQGLPKQRPQHIRHLRGLDLVFELHRGWIKHQMQNTGVAQV